jgi:23S rRNA (cytidine2498-2'-O)-methyltransferase
MPAPAAQPFLFACCREGSEASLKADVLRRHATLLTPAFMRPQLITWKSRAPVDEAFDLASPFARVSGLSLGPCKTEAEVVTKVAERSLARLSLHVFPRVVPEDAEIDWKPLDAIRDRVSTALENAGVKLDDTAGPILSLIIDDKPDAAWFAGLRKRRAGDPLPSGGLPRLSLPSHAPSRAWLKLEQALAWRGWDQLDLRGQTALDLGCAPGGASLALLDRGVRVTGVDTGEMDESVLRHDSGGFRHLRVPLARLDTTKLAASYDLLLCDINLAPPEVLPHIAALCEACRVPRLILTLKLNLPTFEPRVDEFTDYIRRFAPGPVHVTQLAANRREVCVMAGE